MGLGIAGSLRARTGSPPGNTTRNTFPGKCCPMMGLQGPHVASSWETQASCALAGKAAQVGKSAGEAAQVRKSEACHAAAGGRASSCSGSWSSSKCS